MHRIISWSNCSQKCQTNLKCNTQEDLIKTECYADNKVENRLFQESRDRNTKTNNQYWTVFEMNQDFIQIHLICKFQDHAVKTDQVMLIKKSDISYFINQGT